MNIPLLWQDVQRTGITNSQDNQTTFVRALNMVRKDINRRLGLSLTEILSATGDLDIEEYVENCVWPGLRFYMPQYGAWAQDPDAEAYNKYDMTFGPALAQQIKDAITAGTFLTRINTDLE